MARYSFFRFRFLSLSLSAFEFSLRLVVIQPTNREKKKTIYRIHIHDGKEKSANRKVGRKKKGKGRTMQKVRALRLPKKIRIEDRPEIQNRRFVSSGYVASRFQYVKPPDQLKLSDKDLHVEHHRTLTWSDPNVSENKVRFDFQSNEFQNQVPTANDHVAVHFSLDGDTIFEDSEIGLEIVKQRHLKEVKSLKESASGKETKEIETGKRKESKESISILRSCMSDIQP